MEAVAVDVTIGAFHATCYYETTTGQPTRVHVVNNTGATVNVAVGNGARTFTRTFTTPVGTNDYAVPTSVGKHVSFTEGAEDYYYSVG